MRAFDLFEAGVWETGGYNESSSLLPCVWAHLLISPPHEREREKQRERETERERERERDRERERKAGGGQFLGSSGGFI